MRYVLGTIFGMANTLSSFGGFLSSFIVGKLTNNNVSIRIPNVGCRGSILIFNVSAANVRTVAHCFLDFGRNLHGRCSGVHSVRHCENVVVELDEPGRRRYAIEGRGSTETVEESFVLLKTNESRWKTRLREAHPEYMISYCKLLYLQLVYTVDRTEYRVKYSIYFGSILSNFVRNIFFLRYFFIYNWKRLTLES